MAAQELRDIFTDDKGGEIRVYDEYRPNGRGGWAFIGLLVDNGRDRRQVSNRLDALMLVKEWGGRLEDKDE